MSSLWTPGGEIPVDRNRPDPEPDHPAPEHAPDQESQLDEMRRHLLEAPAADVVAQHLMALYELAAMHLGADEPRLADARVAIDAVEAVVEGLSGRLGDAEEAIGAALPQLKMAYVEATDRTTRGIP